MTILCSSILTNIKSMKQSNHTWKGSIHINGTDYIWEQIPTSNPKIIQVKLLTPVKITFEFEPQQQSLSHAIHVQFKMLKLFL